MGTKNSGNSDAETTILSSHRDLIIKAGPSGQLLPDQDLKAQHHHHHHHHHHDENITVNIPRNLNPIKIKVEPLPADHHRDDRITDVDQDHTGDDDGSDGPKTPTGEQHKIPVNQACPPAPKKLCRPLKRRRTLFQNSDVQRPIRLVELSHDELESLFPRRSSTTTRDNGNTHDHHRPGNIKKVNKANFTSLMSFR